MYSSGSWVFFWGDVGGKDAAVLGYYPNPIYLCRTQVNGVMIYGIGNQHVCRVELKGSFMSVNDFQVFSGESSRLVWTLYPSDGTYPNKKA